jgi:chloramphenicol-sensitive protein RarD
MQITPEEHRRGLIYGLAAYGLWGLMPLYFWLVVQRVTPLELVCFRVSWSLVFMLLVVSAKQGWGNVLRAVSHRRTMLALVGSAAMIGCNWIAYVYAVSLEQIMQASLGYFVTPLMNVALGMIFLGERLQTFQKLGIVLAGVGVTIMTIAGGQVPTIALALAVSFGFYALFRKQAAVDGPTGLVIETALVTPLALLGGWYLRSLPTAGPMSVETHALLALGGITTGLPLLFFGAAARRLSLTTLGILQFLAPSMQFSLAVGFGGEKFDVIKQISFAFIWTAVAVYAYGSLKGRARAEEPPEIEPVPEDVIETAEPAVR